MSYCIIMCCQAQKEICNLSNRALVRPSVLKLKNAITAALTQANSARYLAESKSTFEATCVSYP